MDRLLPAPARTPLWALISLVMAGVIVCGLGGFVVLGNRNPPDHKTAGYEFLGFDLHCDLGDAMMPESINVRSLTPKINVDSAFGGASNRRIVRAIFAGPRKALAGTNCGGAVPKIARTIKTEVFANLFTKGHPIRPCICLVGGGLSFIRPLNLQRKVSLVCIPNEIVQRHVSTKLLLGAFSILPEILHKEKQSPGRHNGLGSGGHEHQEGPTLHALLSIKVLLAGLGFLSGGGLVIYAFHQASTREGFAGLLYLMLGLCFMAGAGLYASTLLVSG